MAFTTTSGTYKRIKTPSGFRFQRDGKFISKRSYEAAKRRKGKKPKRRKSRSTRTKTASNRNVAAKKSRRQKVGRMTKTQELFWQGIGAGLKGSAAPLVNRILPVSVSDDIAAGLLGFGLDKYTSGIPKRIGQGMEVSAVAGFAEGLTGSFLNGSDFLGSGGQSSSNVTVA